MNEANKTLNRQMEIVRAEESLKAAQLLFEQGLWRDSISRSYYTAFHMIQALLLTLGIEAKSHSGAQSLFSLHFVKKGVFEPRYARILSKAQKFREESDYDPVSEFGREDAAERLAEVNDLAKRVKAYLKTLE